jgi:phospholipase/carboxylesterase
MRRKIGKLECLCRGGDNPDNHVVLLHGFGADASDLFPLAQFLDPEEQWNFYFPEAPVEVPIGPMWTGRGWFPISVRDLESGIDFTQVRPPGMDESRDCVYDLLFNLNAKNVVMGGFSQGAMVATEVAFENPNDVQGLVLLSGALLDQANWAKKAPALKGKPFIQSHGMQDTVIPFSAAQKLYDLLKGAGLEGQLHAFPGGHEIPVPILQKTKTFMKAIFADR